MMKQLTIAERLNRIEDKIINDPFFGNRALSSGNGGYIFDYDPEDELVVRKFIKDFSSRQDLGFKIHVFDLYEIMIDYLDKQIGLDNVFEVERECKDSDEGLDYLKRAVVDVIQSDSTNDIFINYIKDYIKDNANEGDVIFLTGVGKCHPFVKSHKIINNYDSKLNGVKTVLFYPGVYSGDELRLFGTITSDNYYRSMTLIEREE